MKGNNTKIYSKQAGLLTAGIFFLCCSLSFTFAQDHDYAFAQHISTYFLGGQRCGDTESWIHPSGGCHTSDGEAEGVDLSGGWHDCGDYIKFLVTGPYAAFTYLYGYYCYPEIYPDDYSQAYSAPPPNGIPDVLDEVKIYTDFLIKCVHNGTVYWQVGDGRDHDSFSEPIYSSTQNLYDGSSIRSVYSATSGRSNPLGDAAAALALMSIVYREFDSGYADQCINSAIEFYEIARTSPSATANARDAHYSWMSGAEWEDNVGLASIMLYNATDNDTYLTHARDYGNGLTGYISFSYGNMHHLLFLELYKETGDNTWLDKVGNQVNSMSLAPCGYHHNTGWGSLRDAGNAAMLAALYHQQTGDTDAYEFAKRNVDFILGTHDGFANVPANFSFLIGYDVLGGGYPQHPHHAAAFGKEDNAWTHYTNEGNTPGSVSYEYELTGGLAGGPESECGNFYDNIDNYVSSEYCIYYNAAFTGAAAYVNLIENGAVSAPGFSIQKINKPSFSIYSGISEPYVSFSINRPGNIKIMVITASGRNVVSIEKHFGSAGSFRLPLITGSSRFPAGVYLVKYSIPGKQGSEQTVFLR